MCATPEFFTAERHDAEFEHKLRQAIFRGRAIQEDPTCLDAETTAAIHAVAALYPNVTFESVRAARQEFAWQIDGTHVERRGHLIGSYHETATKRRVAAKPKD